MDRAVYNNHQIQLNWMQPYHFVITQLLNFLLLAFILSGVSSVLAEETFNLITPSEQELEIRKFSGDGKTLILWLPSESGPDSATEEHAIALSNLGYDVWIPEFHRSYFLLPGLASVSKIPIEDIVAVIEAAIKGSNAKIILMSSNRGAQLALIAARQWQLKHPGITTGIQGVLLMHAYLYDVSPEVGKQVDYMPIVRATNLPVFLLDAEFSTTALRIQNLAQALGTGGSQIYTQIIKNVERRFQSKQDSELSPNDLTAKQNFAKTLDQAFRLLSITDVPDSAVASDLQTSRYSRVPKRNTSLIEVTDPVLAPQLKLPGFDESVYTLEKYLGKIILVNFWASWCGPCVEEIPSLHRLKSKVQNPQFEIVTVNIGESRERIGDFLQQVPIEFPVLMDVDGTASKQWNVHFYPSNYLVDQRGIIRYVHQGALEWDSPENIEIIQKLLLP